MALGKPYLLTLRMRDIKIRIKQAREAARKTQQQAADGIGKSRQLVSRWENLELEDMPSLADLEKLAAEYDASPSWLFVGASDDLSLGPPVGTKVPLISLVQAGEPELPVDIFEPGDGEDWFYCPISHGLGTHVLRVEGPSMTSDNPLEESYPSGTLIFCDPSQRGGATSGCPVIAVRADTGEATFKLYYRDGKDQWLAPINKSFPKITCPFEIKSLVIGQFRYSAKR